MDGRGSGRLDEDTGSEDEFVEMDLCDFFIVVFIFDAGNCTCYFVIFEECENV